VVSPYHEHMWFEHQINIKFYPINSPPIYFVIAVKMIHRDGKFKKIIRETNPISLCYK
jgi:hypothetical protein